MIKSYQYHDKGLSDMQERLWKNDPRTILICVDAYENKILKGRFYNKTLPNGAVFHSTIELLRSMECLLDTNQSPQSFVSIRSWNEAMTYSITPAQQSCVGAYATFSVHILFRQNAGWQGTIHWFENNQRLCFRSVLEFLFLIDNALSTKHLKEDSIS